MVISVLMFIMGVFSLLFYILWRMMRSDGWDDSNITNAIRLLAHVTLHPEDFGKMFYLTPEQHQKLLELSTAYQWDKPKRPFWYVSKDEFESVVRSRPDA